MNSARDLWLWVQRIGKYAVTRTWGWSLALGHSALSSKIKVQTQRFLSLKPPCSLLTHLQGKRPNTIVNIHEHVWCVLFCDDFLIFSGLKTFSSRIFFGFLI